MKFLRLIAVVVPVILIGMILYVNRISSPPRPGGQEQVFVVKQGETGADIAQRLQDAGFIRSASFFRWMLRNRNLSALQAGEYRLSPSMAMRDILAALFGGSVGMVKNRITIPEGFNAAQVAERVQAHGYCSYDQFMNIVRNPASEGVNTHGQNLPTLEGFLYPETYYFLGGANCFTVAQQMVDMFFDRVSSSDIEAARARGFSLLQIVTIASLVEEEAQHEDERNVVAGVIYNRLRANMRLQIDATVQYALPEHKTRLVYKDLEVESPYNTYRHSGIPPGPICNPGMPSIRAALEPAQIPYYYYVARADGSHIFTRNGAEHARAIREARKTWRR